MAYDHIDALLFAAGFVASIVVCATFDLPSEFAAGSALLPSAIRRRIFGAPKLPPPRTGAFWSLASILGLFAILIGVALLWGSSVSLRRMLSQSSRGYGVESIARSHGSDFLWTFLPGTGLVSLGAFLTWIRYPRPEASPEIDLG